jgi:hypothetical protein
MANGEAPKNDTSSSVWNRLDQHGDQISELARSQATIEANLSSLAESVSAGFADINRAISRFNERDSRPTNWLAVGIGIAGLLGFAVTFVTLIVAPLDARISLVEEGEKSNSEERE